MKNTSVMCKSHAKARNSRDVHDAVLTTLVPVSYCEPGLSVHSGGSFEIRPGQVRLMLGQKLLIKCDRNL